MKSNISTLFLDVGGVLLTNGWDRHSRELAVQNFNLDLKDFNNRHGLTFDMFELGKITLLEYLKRVVFFQKRNFTEKQFVDFMLAQSKPYEKMLELIKELKKKYSLKIVLVSNEGRELVEYRSRTFQFHSFVDISIYSCFVHLRKPDFDIYHIALDVSQVNPKEVLYIDDRELFVQVAGELGIQGIVHSDFNSTLKRLSDFGLVI